MASRSFAVVRPDDLFQAVFRFDGFHVEGGLLIREPGPARLVIRFPPQAIVEQALAAKAGVIQPSPPAALALLAARRSGASRLAFDIPADVETLPLSLDAWLDWSRFRPVLPIDRDEDAPEQPEPPDDKVTAIELPVRVILAPEPGGRWRHEMTAPDPAAGAVELWRTVLAGDRLVRVAWTPDAGNVPPLPFATPLSADSRRDAMGLTAHLHLLDSIRAEFLNEANQQRLDLLKNRTAVPIRVDRLELSALGGSLAFRHDFPDLDLTGLLHLLDGHEFDQGTRLFSLLHWSHRTRLGRDMHIRTVTAGHVFPYGHRALRVDVTDRVLVPDPMAAENVAWLVTRTVIALDEDERTYPAGAWPFAAVRFPVDVSVEMPAPAEGNLPTFTLPATATDRNGAMHAFQAQLLFVPQASVIDPFPQFQRLDREARLPGAPLAFVPGPGGAYPTTLIRVSAQPAGPTGAFMPIIEIARVVPEAVMAFAEGQREAVIAYTQDAADGLVTDAFARLVTPIKVVVGAARAGGLAAPQFTLDTLSQAAGVTLGLAPGGDPAVLIRNAIGGRLLGLFDLAAMIDTSAAAAALPVFRRLAEGPDQTLAFEWHPQLELPLVGDTPPRLELSGRIGQAGAVPRVTLSGAIFDLKLDFAGLFEFGFARLGFSSGTGRPIAVDTLKGHFAFKGDLAFLSRIADAFTANAPGAGTGTRVTAMPNGIAASFELALPKIAMGQFTLIDLALSSALRLQFDAPAQVSLGLSSRAAPFLVSYSGLGGGGYFLLVSDLDKVLTLEAAIEFGAVVAINLAILNASAQIVAGIYIAIDDSSGTRKSRLSGYVRAHGAVEIFGIVTVALDVMLSLVLEGTIVTGRAEVTIMVQVLAFSRSVSFSFSQSFDAGAVLPGVQTQAEMRLDAPVVPGELPVQRDWAGYCRAFA